MIRPTKSALVAATISSLAPLSLGAANVVDSQSASAIHDSAPWWLYLVGSVVGPVATWSIVIVARVLATSKRARAAERRKQAHALLGDKDKANDEQGRRLLEAAASDQAVGDLLDSLAEKTDPNLRLPLSKE